MSKLFFVLVLALFGFIGCRSLSKQTNVRERFNPVVFYHGEVVTITNVESDNTLHMVARARGGVQILSLKVVYYFRIPSELITNSEGNVSFEKCFEKYDTCPDGYDGCDYWASDVIDWKMISRMYRPQICLSSEVDHFLMPLHEDLSNVGYIKCTVTIQNTLERFTESFILTKSCLEEKKNRKLEDLVTE